ncbi:MAG: imidazole glycerol phosphate synthase subunit HisH [Planctomycetota bacterium]
MIAILDYEAGNLTSVDLAVREAGGDPKVTQDPADVRAAERVIFPGVGAAGHCMENLRRLGLDRALREAVESGKPVLGICIGIQLLFERSAEDGGVECLGILPGEVVPFDFPEDAHVKVPHMGWNEILPTKAHPVLAGVEPGDECYFVHSYHVQPERGQLILAECKYADYLFPCAVEQHNLVATQFHPEKSGPVGLQILRNFLAWDGTL